MKGESKHFFCFSFFEILMTSFFLMSELGGGFKYFFFTPKIGEMIQFDLRIFFRGVGEKPPTS